MKKYIIILLVVALPLISAEQSGREEIFENPLWKQIYRDYVTDPGIIEILRSKRDGIDTIDIYFAFWCGDSETNVPPFMKILDEIDVSGKTVNFLKCDRKKQGETYYFEKLKVERVPTFIFFKDGKEIGRIVENPKTTLEEDFLGIIF